MGRGSSKAGGNTSGSNAIKNQILEKGLNSKFAGVRRQAAEGTGRFTFKNSTAVSSKDALKMDIGKVYEEDGNTLIDGVLNNKSVFYAAKSSDSTIKTLKEKHAKSKKRQAEDLKRMERPEIKTTSTYDRWKKKNDANFAAWFGKR